jgi:Rsm1-like
MLITYIDSIFKLPLNHPGRTIQNLRNRYDELCIRKETLPYMMNMRTPPNFDLDLILSYLPPDFFACSSTQQIEIPTQPEINEVAFLMALFGWQGHTHDKLGEQLGSVSCQACFRVLGLWLFKSKEINEAGEEVTGAAMNKLDVIKVHRDYCPWQNATSQNGQRSSVISSTSNLAGWEIILRILKNDHHLRSSGERLGSRGSRQHSVDNASETASPFVIDVDDEEAKSIRDEKDKTMLRRLRRVKSLFETKGKRLQRPGTRNETPAA